MDLIKYDVESPKEILEVGIALGAILRATGEALKDGFQPGEDLPVIITSAIAHLGQAIQGVNEVGNEFKEMPVHASLGLINPIMVGVAELIKLKK